MIFPCILYDFCWLPTLLALISRSTTQLCKASQLRQTSNTITLTLINQKPIPSPMSPLLPLLPTSSWQDAVVGHTAPCSERDSPLAPCRLSYIESPDKSCRICRTIHNATPPTAGRPPVRSSTLLRTHHQQTRHSSRHIPTNHTGHDLSRRRCLYWRHSRHNLRSTRSTFYVWARTNLHRSPLSHRNRKQMKVLQTSMTVMTRASIAIWTMTRMRRGMKGMKQLTRNNRKLIMCQQTEHTKGVQSPVCRHVTKSTHPKST